MRPLARVAATGLAPARSSGGGGGGADGAFRSGVDRRDELLRTSPRWYRGELHFAAVNLLGVALLALGASGLRAVRGVELLTVPAAFLFANLVEWRLHGGPLHRRGFPDLLYRRHTLGHHAAFSDRAMAVRDARELRLVLFPLPALFGAAAVAALVAVPVGLLATPNAGRLFFVVGVAYYLLYEWCHLSFHLPRASLLGRNVVVRWLRPTHARHHDPRLMRHRNFNVTFPIADALFGTLDRGGAVDAGDGGAP